LFDSVGLHLKKHRLEGSKPTLVTEFTKVVEVDQIHHLSVERESFLSGWSLEMAIDRRHLLLQSLGIWFWA